MINFSILGKCLEVESTKIWVKELNGILIDFFINENHGFFKTEI